jgi:hypothetical protein
MRRETNLRIASSIGALPRYRDHGGTMPFMRAYETD